MLIPFLLLAVPGHGQDTLTLADALVRAHARRSAVAATAADLAAARAGIRVAGTVPNPIVSYTRTQDLPRQHVLVDQSFDWVLSRGAERAAARADLARAHADSAVQTADLDLEVRSAFFQALAARERVRFAAQGVRLADSLTAIAEARFQAGDIAAVERDHIALDAGRVRQDLSLAVEEAAVALLSLGRTIAWDASTPPTPVGTLDGGLDSAESPAVDPEQQGEVRRAESDAAAASARVRIATRRGLPIPSVQAGADWDDPSQPGRTLSVIGFSIPVPLWNHNGGEAARARAEASGAAARVAEARLEAADRIRTTRVRMDAAAARARFARDTLLPQAVALRARAFLAYQTGETSVLPVLDALRTERETSVGVVDALEAWQRIRALWARLEEVTP